MNKQLEGLKVAYKMLEDLERAQSEEIHKLYKKLDNAKAALESTQKDKIEMSGKIISILQDIVE